MTIREKKAPFLWRLVAATIILGIISGAWSILTIQFDPPRNTIQVWTDNYVSGNVSPWKMVACAIFEWSVFVCLVFLLPVIASRLHPARGPAFVAAGALAALLLLLASLFFILGRHTGFHMLACAVLCAVYGLIGLFFRRRTALSGPSYTTVALVTAGLQNS